MAAKSSKTKPAPAGVTIDQEYEVVRIDGDHDPLREHPQNPRRGVIEAIDESIDVNGWYGAVIAQKSTGYILAGNHRFRAAVAKGATAIPVIWRDVDDEIALRILLADNKTADLGTYDEELITELLDGLDTLDGTGYGFNLVQEEIENPSAPPAALAPDEVPDDVYTPDYGVMIVCDSEKQQEMTYKWLQEQIPNRTIRVVAV